MCGQMPSGDWRTKPGVGALHWGIQSGDPKIQEENGKWSECNQSKRTVTQMTKDNGREVKAVPPRPLMLAVNTGRT
ncbi:putative E3 ubiquitin-protein ligase HECTD4 [Clarias magur]|uniref:Putative E3 ubiquitin-protein ligase HECTD4 n=1 Tax=Clarias magur TaxID=1594786 RepID=A0A8J4TPS1_CLAMG|nr:putative E3 ubiquitin-protein ligase HECTD4 [Clarias magur]